MSSESLLKGRGILTPLQQELERWPVKMLKPFEPAALKKSFQALALEIMDRMTQK
jgi:hypothetical protein